MNALSFFLVQKGQAFVNLSRLADETLLYFHLQRPGRDTLRDRCARFIRVQQISYAEYSLPEELEDSLASQITLDQLTERLRENTFSPHHQQKPDRCYRNLNANLYIVDFKCVIFSASICDDRFVTTLQKNSFSSGKEVACCFRKTTGGRLFWIYFHPSAEVKIVSSFANFDGELRIPRSRYCSCQVLKLFLS